MNIYNVIKHLESHSPDRLAVINGERGNSLNYRELDLLIARFSSALLELGLRPGDRAAVYLPNSLEYIISYFAIVRLGAVVAPCSIEWKPEEIGDILSQVKPRILIVSAKHIKTKELRKINECSFLERLVTVGEITLKGAYSFDKILSGICTESAVVECSPNDLATIVFPWMNGKGVMLSHENLLSCAQIYAKEIYHGSHHDIYLSALPFSDVSFMQAVLAPLLTGAVILISKGLSPQQTLQQISKFKVTHFIGDSKSFEEIIQEQITVGYDIDGWRYALSLGPVRSPQYALAIRNFLGVLPCQGYGWPEAGPVVILSYLKNDRSSLTGVPVPGYKFKVVNSGGMELTPGNTGYLMVKGPGVFKGYWEMPEETVKKLHSGWFLTGDLAKFDEHGYCYLVGSETEKNNSDLELMPLKLEDYSNCS